MKSKLSFTKLEAAEIIKLIQAKLKAEPTKQKGIRDKIRKIGFMQVIMVFGMDILLSSF